MDIGEILSSILCLCLGAILGFLISRVEGDRDVQEKVCIQLTSTLSEYTKCNNRNLTDIIKELK
jgi:hypothetical protein